MPCPENIGGAHHVFPITIGMTAESRASGLIPYIIYTNPVYKPESTGSVRARRLTKPSFIRRAGYDRVGTREVKPPFTDKSR